MTIKRVREGSLKVKDLMITESEREYNVHI